MFLCINCGNNIKSSNKQFTTSTINYKMTGCPRWKFYIKCDCCNNINNYKYLIAHKILFIPTLLQILN
jgi:hypothetical protein